MPKTKLGTEIKNYGRKRLKSGLSCSLTPSLESEDVKTFVKETLASGDKGNILLTTAIIDGQKCNSCKYPNFFDTPDDNVVKVWV